MRDSIGSAPGRGRRWLWGTLAFLFLVGIAVSTMMIRSERTEALDAAVEGARDEAHLATATLTRREFTKPVTGLRYDKLATELRKTISSDGTIVGVTIWSSRGRILFSSNESLVGKTPPEMRSLIKGIAEGSGSTRVVDGNVQTFTPVSRATDGPVAVVEIDQPVGVVEAQAGDLWSMLRLGSALGLAVSLLFLVLTFVRARRTARDRGERPKEDEQHEGDVSAESDADGQSEAGPTKPSGPSYEEVFALEHEHDETIEHDAHLEDDPDALEGDPEALKSIRQWDDKYEDIVLEELQTQELMRQRREEFKVRAEAAALRVKKLEAEPHEASPTPD
ncbi:MAG TPA: hypothetical protein VJ774_02325 [Actinomycetota bacterium]|nr:hypothetical protein [Actinomycetota bacterium]